MMRVWKKCMVALVTAFVLYMTSFYTSEIRIKIKIGSISQQQALPLNGSLIDGNCGR